MAKLAVILAVFLVIFVIKVDANMVAKMERLQDILAHITESDPCGTDIIAYYKFDRSCRDVCFGNNAVKHSIDKHQEHSPGISKKAMKFFPTGYLSVPSLNGYEWGSNFSVSFWFKQESDPSVTGVINQGLINNYPVNTNGANSSGSWEIRIQQTSRTEEHSIGASFVTSHSAKTWDTITTTNSNHWHHLVMTYDGDTINFYLDNHLKLSDSKCCHGDILTRNTDVVIGRTEHGIKYNDVDGRWYDGYFDGSIDELKMFKKALNSREVTKLYQLKNV